MKGAPLVYHITTDRAGTVRLSKAWHWGNIPMESEADAEGAAHADADGKPFTIERKRIR